VRFIRVCVLYADRASEPHEKFKLFHKHKIGSNVAIFWLAWAWVAESRGDFPFADKILRKALQKKAKPIKTVEQRFKQFQRRMSRHWLNAQEKEGSDASDEDNEVRDSRRGALSGLTEEGVQQNNRARGMNAMAGASRPILAPRNGQQKSNPKTGENGVDTKKGFSIFMEDNLNENEYNLNQSMAQGNEENNALPPRIVREKDSKKENTLSAEAWNERGGLHSYRQMGRYGVSGGQDEDESISSVARRWAGTGSESLVAGGTSSQSAFQVFVDEDCAQKEEDGNSNMTNKRSVSCGRGTERTLRQRLDDGKSRKPLSMMHRSSSDESSSGSRGESKHHQNSVSRQYADKTAKLVKTKLHSDKGRILPKQIKCGFDEKIISKGSKGSEKCFEERRSRAGSYNLASSQINFNLLHVKTDQRFETEDQSYMDMDDASTIEEVDMEDDSVSQIISDENRPPHGVTIATLNATAFHDRKAPLNVTTLHSTLYDSVSKATNPRKVLFDVNTSMGNRSIISAPNNASTASSAIDEQHAVGLQNDKEETVNTKFAARELSMMFSSPAVNGSMNHFHGVKSSKQLHSDRLLFSVHRNKEAVDDSHDSSYVVESQNEDNAAYLVEISRDVNDQEHSAFAIYQDDTQTDRVETFSCNELLKKHVEIDSDSSDDYSEDDPGGDTASLADILGLMQDNTPDKVKQKDLSNAKSGEEFSIYCDNNAINEKKSRYSNIDNGTVLIDDTTAFGNISFIPHKGSDTIYIQDKLKLMNLSDNGHSKR